MSQDQWIQELVKICRQNEWRYPKLSPKALHQLCCSRGYTKALRSIGYDKLIYFAVKNNFSTDEYLTDTPTKIFSNLNLYKGARCFGIEIKSPNIILTWLPNGVPGRPTRIHFDKGTPPYSQVGIEPVREGITPQEFYHQHLSQY
jgi:hypothetical protein